jgi:predicted nucleotidyltransferase
MDAIADTEKRHGGFRHPSELPQVIDPVAAYIDVLSRDPAVEKLILFGSRAIGDNWPRSDVDMAVVLNTDDRKAWRRVAGSADRARTLIPIDLVLYEETGGRLREQIDRNGRVVYERASV